MKYLSLFILIFLMGCLPRPKIVEAPLDVYIVPQENKYKAEVLALKAKPPPFKSVWYIQIFYKYSQINWVFTELDLKEDGLNNLLSRNDVGLECDAIREKFSDQDIVSVSCNNGQWLRTRGVACTRGVKDSAEAENNVIDIYVMCDAR